MGTKVKLENDPRFLRRIASARRSLKAGKGIRIEDLGRSKRDKDIDFSDLPEV